ncbi:MAG TPA: helix-turn-helix domain-containing protein [Clostridiales bacterium]|nr:helix-turn-helix domain-containing protein [Clostridiales bacterium]
MLITYKANNDEIRFADPDINELSKEQVIIELGKSKFRLNKLQQQIDREKALHEKLLKRRLEFYKYEKAEELKANNNMNLSSKKSQIELYYSQGKGYDEIALLTEASPAYIYNVVCSYRKKNTVPIKNPEKTEIEEAIIMYSRVNKNIKEIAKNSNVSRQYVYKVLKKHNIPYPSIKRK